VVRVSYLKAYTLKRSRSGGRGECLFTSQQPCFCCGAWTKLISGLSPLPKAKERAPNAFGKVCRRKGSNGFGLPPPHSDSLEWLMLRIFRLAHLVTTPPRYPTRHSTASSDSTNAMRPRRPRDRHRLQPYQPRPNLSFLRFRRWLSKGCSFSRWIESPNQAREVPNFTRVVSEQAARLPHRGLVVAAVDNVRRSRNTPVLTKFIHAIDCHSAPPKAKKTTFDVHAARHERDRAKKKPLLWRVPRLSDVHYLWTFAANVRRGLSGGPISAASVIKAVATSQQYAKRPPLYDSRETTRVAIIRAKPGAWSAHRDFADSRVIWENRGRHIAKW
jgi:hypothetical protein